MKFVLLESQFLCIRMSALLQQFTELNSICVQKQRQLRQQQQQSASLPEKEANLKKMTKNLSIWRQYLALNRRLVTICKQCDNISSYWSTFLSVFLAGLIATQCYVAYITFFVDGLPLLMGRAIFGYGTVCMTAFLFLLVHYCSLVARMGGALGRVNGQFYVIFMRSRNGLKYLSKEQLLKVY